jgi:Neurotransmitter-gated ion-channel ligand binding domain/Neurotransmitter-gated ion-channel transmembrane region
MKKKVRKSNLLANCGRFLAIAVISMPIFPTLSMIAQEQPKETTNQQETVLTPSQKIPQNTEGKNPEQQEKKKEQSLIPSNYEKERIPPNNNKPVPVSVGVYIINFAGITEPQETYQIVGYLAANWTDTRLKFDPKKVGSDEIIFNDKDQIWHPDIEFFNQVGNRNSARVQIIVTPEGKVNYIESFDATISSDLQLQKFPFDQQRLRLIVDSFQYHDKQVIFKANQDKIGVNREPFVSLSEWNIKGVKHEENAQFFPQDNNTYSRLNIYFEIERNSGFYILKVFIPLAIIFGISCAGFWITLESLDILTAIGVTNLLTGIAFSLTISGSLPKVAYLTFIDGFVGLIYMFIFFSILEAILLNYFANQGDKQKEIAEDLHKKGRLLFPLGFGVGNIILWIMLLI